MYQKLKDVKDLQKGQIVKSISGNAYVITFTGGSFAIGVQSAHITNPDEWKVYVPDAEETEEPKTKGALEAKIAERASNRLKKEIYELYEKLVSDGLVNKDDDYVRNLRTAKEYDSFYHRQYYRFLGPGAEAMYNEQLPAYIEKETAAILEDIATTKYFKEHPEAD